MRPVGVWLSVLVSVLAVTAAATGCWLQPTGVLWLINLAVLAILVLVTVAYDQPGRHLLRTPFGWLYPLAGAAGAVSVVRAPSLAWSLVSSMAMGSLVVTLVVLAFVVAGLREPGHLEVRAPLLFPLPSGRWAVGAGGVAALNHHLTETSQAAAVDLIAVRRDGARATGVCPRALSAYEAYGHQVVSPCDGVVVGVVDGVPESPWSRGHGTEPLGNHVSIENSSGEVLYLAHLRPGSTAVVPGEHVAAGQPVAEVGCSGRTSEPNLHVHAERDGVSLRLRFADVPARRLRPGSVLAVAGPVQPRVDS